MERGWEWRSTQRPRCKLWARCWTSFLGLTIFISRGLWLIFASYVLAKCGYLIDLISNVIFGGGACEQSPLLQSEGVNIVRSNVAKQHRRVCRIKAHPTGERPCLAESLQIDNTLRITT